jgi:hypothetical protein
MTDQLLKCCDLYRKTSRGPGNREYLVGYAGSLKVLIFRNNNATEDGPTHTLFFTERKPRPERPPAADAQRGQGTQTRMREVAAAWPPPLPEAGDQIDDL